MRIMDTEIDYVGYAVLWVIVILLSAVIFMEGFYFEIGHGRWECTEYLVGCTAHDSAGNIIFSVSDVQYANLTEKYFCDTFESKCIKEVWTRHID